MTSDARRHLANGVDLERFRPGRAPDPRRILFIGSFAHPPNVLAMEFFVHEVWPLLRDVTLHIIAGARHEQYAVGADLAQPGIELEGFVADVRPAYQRATLVVAPLVASAGTNIKVLEAMAMGKAVVSTPAGVNGLDLTPGEDFVLVQTAQEMAAAIENAAGRPDRPCPHRSCRPRPRGTRLQLGHDRPRPVGPVPRTAGKLIPTRAATRLWDRAVTRGARAAGTPGMRRRTAA